jgi:ATP-binding cassette, subfamily B, bacterial MsbA
MMRSVGHPKWPLAPFVRKIYPFLPLVAALGLLAGLLEGAGIGLFIPLLAILISDSLPSGLPEPIRALASLFNHYDPQARAVLLGAAIFGLIILKGVVQAANECLVASIAGRVGRDIRNALARTLLTLDYPFFLKHGPARLTRIMSTDSWFVLEAVDAVLTLIPAAAGVLVFSVILALLNIELFAIVVAGAWVLQVVLYLAERRQQRLSHELTASDQHLWERLLTIVQAPRVIRLFGQREREQARAAAASEGLRQTIQASEYQAAFVHPLVDAMIALLLLVVLFAGYWSGMSIPAITAFVLLLTRAQPHAKTISRARLGIASFRGSVSEVEWLLSQERSRPLRAGGPIERLDRPIVFDNVSYAYPNGHRGLDNVTLTIEPGIATAVIGQSGSGKTTLVNLLCRLIEPQSGAIRLGSDPVVQFDVESWRRRIAIAGQDSELVTGTVTENIAYGLPEASAADIEDATRAAGADKFVHGFAQGYDTPVGPHGLTLSGGQRQRIGLARALLLHPDVLVLDEATNAVDALSEAEIMKLIAEHRYFHTMLIISHRKTTLSACEHGVVLDNGRVCEAGPLADLAYFKAMAGSTDVGE